MKQCPECLNQVVDPAVACKYCGYIFDGQAKPLTPRLAKEPAPAKIMAPIISNQQSLITAVAVLLVLCLAVYFLFFRDKDSSSNRDTKATTINAASMCQEFVLEKLLSPKTAKFQNMYDARVIQIDSSHFVVNSYVDSQNAFGTPIRNQYICRIRYISTSNWMLTEAIQFLP